MQELFISKSPKEIPQLVSLCKHNRLVITAKSLIKFKSLTAFIPETLDLIFFTSPRSVRFFFEKIPPGFKCNDFACMGLGTERALKLSGYTSSFTGVFSSEPDKVFLDFKKWAGNRLITVPHSSQSLFSISKYFPKKQLSFIEIYKTEYKKIQVTTSKIYVFTSPSNVDAFLLTNVLPKDAQIIAWGTSTKKFLITKGISPNHTLTIGHESELIRLLNLH